MEPLLERPGVFVLGSNDYFAPKPKNPPSTSPATTRAVRGRPAAHLGPGQALTDAGWIDLTNARATLAVAGRDLELVGVDDPHLQYDRYDRVAGPADPLGGADGRRDARAVPAGAGRHGRATAPGWSSPATPTAASCACPATARW